MWVFYITNILTPINIRSFKIPFPPLPTQGRLTVVRVRGGMEIWVLLGCGGGFKPELSSLFSGMHMFYILMWKCLKVDFTYAI